MKQQQFIQCPECGSVELATIGHTFPFPTFLHECRKCSMVIMESEWDAIPALSIKQPFAWLIVKDFKWIENRPTLKNFRGVFLIHASASYDRKWEQNVHPHIVNLIKEAIGDKYISHQMKAGGIVGYATITDCVQKSDSPWFIGPNGFVIEKPHSLPFTPCKGALGFFQPKIFTK